MPKSTNIPLATHPIVKANALPPNVVWRRISPVGPSKALSQDAFQAICSFAAQAPDIGASPAWAHTINGCDVRSAYAVQAIAKQFPGDKQAIGQIEILLEHVDGSTLFSKYKLKPKKEDLVVQGALVASSAWYWHIAPCVMGPHHALYVLDYSFTLTFLTLPEWLQKLNIPSVPNVRSILNLRSIKATPNSPNTLLTPRASTPKPSRKTLLLLQHNFEDQQDAVLEQAEKRWRCV